LKSTMSNFQAPTSLSEFIDILRREREVVEVSVEVDPKLEIAEIHRRVIERGGPAIIFSRVKGAEFPLITNLFGTKRRVDLAFGGRPEKMMQEVARLPETLMPPGLSSLWRNRRTLFGLSRVGLRRRRFDSDLIVDTPPRLGRLPMLTTWKLDGGPFITLPLVYTEHPTSRIHNLGMYRIQRYDEETTGLHCQIGKGGGFHLAAAKELGKKLPVNIYVGGPPALILGAIAPLPENVPELLFSSFVLGKKIPLCENPIGELPIVSSAEFTLVGEVDPTETRPEGPFGDHYGYYSWKHDYPVFRCKGLIRRPGAIFPATVVGKPRQEDYFIGEYLQRLLSPLFPLVMPQVVDLWSYGETGFHSLAAAVVRERYKREMLVSGFRILGEGQLALTKFLLLVDRPMQLSNFRSVLEYVLARADFRTDLYVFSNTAMDTLDYTGPEVNKGSKGLLLGQGDPVRELPKEIPSGMSGAVTLAGVFCKGCLAVQGTSYKEDPKLAEILSQDPALRNWPLVVLVDDVAKATASEISFLWTTFTRFEPAADIYAARTQVVRHHLSYELPIVIDARMKPWYPDVVECDEDTESLVDSRWREYF
jgi:UbiD family decarboxylase